MIEPSPAPKTITTSSEINLNSATMKTEMPSYLVPTFQVWIAPSISSMTIWLAGDPNSQGPSDSAVAAPVTTLIGPFVPFGKDYHVLVNLEPTKAPLISP